MIDPREQHLTRRRVRLFLLAGLSALFLLLLGAGLYAGRSLNGLSRTEVATTSEYLLRTGYLQNGQRLLLEVHGAIRNHLLDSGEQTASLDVRKVREQWAEALTELRRYRILAPDQERLVNRLEGRLAQYWQVSEEAIRMDVRRRRREGPEFLLARLTPLRDALMATLGALRTLERDRLSVTAQNAQQEANREQTRVWTVIAIACILALLVAGATFWRLRGLEREASDQYDAAVQSASELERLSERLVNLQEEERKKIARDLHDDFGQRLASLIFEVSNIAERPALPGELKSSLEAAGERLAGVANDLQQLSHGLHSAVLEKIGLAAAVRSDCTALEKRSALTVHFRDSGVPRRLPENIALAFYRVSQEAMQNALKHSHTSRLDVSLDLEGHDLVLRVSDFGCGFNSNGTGGSSDGLGLISIRERLRMVGGAASIASESGKGSTVEARVSLHDDQLVGKNG